ncbi:hypothetical protein [Flavihumibacter profundi]|uniref:hypothetical protein n=1 Tax=Flavihumibacter profundi TaxID=2716883 RepID=UPI001CC43FF4|nr:hypothetical protein [Flavihumibacter profundi]MBZ5858280.1 hypothetical protein [Flavihumibacter profundi]
MIGIFKQKNPGNAFILLIYALILKFPVFLHMPAPLRQEEDNYLYRLVLDLLKPLAGEKGFLYGLLAFILLYLQATLLNRIANTLKILPRPSYLVGMSFLLLSSLLPEWNQFSSTLIVNFLLIWIWYGMTGLYNNQKPLSAIFNVCLLTGALPLIYSPSLAYIVMLILALIITRPLRVGEWVIAGVGFVTPYYFLLVILFLTNQWQSAGLMPVISFHLPRLPASLWTTAGMLLMVGPFLVGGFFVQDNLNKMLIQVRKCWSLLLAILLVGLLIILVNPGTNYQHWFLSSVPITCFHAATYYYPNKRTIPLILHWVTFAFAIAVNYFPHLS